MPGRLRENGEIKTKIHISRILQILNSESDYSQSQGERLRYTKVVMIVTARPVAASSQGLCS